MNSKIEARIEAVKLALNVEGVTSENIIEVSEKIADFIIGSAELPDNYDSNAMTKELMAKAFANLPTTNYQNDENKEQENSGHETPEKA